MKRTKWRAYSELAWTEPIIAPPEEYVKETELFSKVINEHSKIKPRTLLHLGCGAGGNDYTFKKHFKVTGVDISKGMLEIAEKLNPEVNYIYGDMRTIKLKEYFDAVAIPDSIGYMTTLEDLRKTIITAYEHLNPGGVLLIVSNIREEFRENNFVYTGSKGDVEITIFENNCIPNPAGTTYQATLIYLVLRKGKLKIHTECHIIGLFKLKTWLNLLKELGLKINQMKLEHSYDRFILGKGDYSLSMFVCSKPLIHKKSI
ncbi:MAG TPA: SAM-dependent methyltransferase [Elusimicrobia bacterium]|nr:SAM-dependent methyltransferase [Elusimicrobiota bacterium]